MVITMIFRLGYVDGPVSLPNITFHTMTYKTYKMLPKKDADLKLATIIDKNLDNLLKILEFNKENNIYFYRISPTIIPLATLKEVEFDYLIPYKEKWQNIGRFINNNNIRIDIHPNQYTVLNSPSEEIVERSIETLKYLYDIFKIMDVNSKVILHIGGKYDNKEAAILRFKTNFNRLPTKLKKIIVLENDDKIYTLSDTLNICEELNIPMVLDYHHYLINRNNEKLKDYLSRIINTWKSTNLNPKIHFSSPKSKKDIRSHHLFADYNSFLKFIKILSKVKQDFDIMLECKEKDNALFRLSKQLKYTKNIEFINYSTFKIKDNSL